MSKISEGIGSAFGGGIKQELDPTAEPGILGGASALVKGFTNAAQRGFRSPGGAWGSVAANFEPTKTDTTTATSSSNKVANKTTLNAKTQELTVADPVSGRNVIYVYNNGKWISRETNKQVTDPATIAQLNKQYKKLQVKEEKTSLIQESGNVFGDGPVLRTFVRGIVEKVKSVLPKKVDVVPDIGSAGYKIESGDIDLFIDAVDLMKHFGVSDEKSVKKELETYMKSQGFKAKTIGRNVHIEVPYNTPDGTRHAQVDLMVITDAKRVADWHQHGLRGMYDEPNFKAAHIFILLNSIGKFLGLKTDAFAGKVLRRDDNTVVADNRDAAAKVLLNSKAKASDLNSVKSILKALENDPDREAKLAQAREDEAKGLITFPSDITEGSVNWFRKLIDRI